jgi:hypothetical protein
MARNQYSAYVSVWLPNIAFGILAFIYYEMQNDKLKAFKPPSECFIWGFTAILGVNHHNSRCFGWYRMF